MLSLGSRSPFWSAEAWDFKIDLLVFAACCPVISLPHKAKFAFGEHLFTVSEGFICLSLRGPLVNDVCLCPEAF